MSVETAHQVIEAEFAFDENPIPVIAHHRDLMTDKNAVPVEVEIADVIDFEDVRTKKYIDQLKFWAGFLSMEPPEFSAAVFISTNERFPKPLEWDATLHRRVPKQ